MFAGLKTGVITNNWIDDTSDHQSNQFMTSFLNGHFDLVLQSCQLGIRKPNPLIYRLACHRLGVQPSEVFITLTHSLSLTCTHILSHMKFYERFYS